jgi:flagellar hook protein FlgE
MLQSIYAGISGLQSFQTGIDVLANNIANVNTVGFRGSSTEFSNLFESEIASSSATTSGQLGLGTKVSAISLDLSAGEFYQTENATDLAIIGDDGWFGLTGLGGDEYYTRAGNFNFEPYSSSATQTDLRLTNPEGYLVTGTLANNTNNGQLSPIVESLELDLANVDSQVPLVFPSDLSFPVVPSTQADFFGNLGIEDLPQVISASVISPQSERNNLRLEFVQTTPQPASGTSWDIVATTQTADGSVIYDTQTGVVSFDDSGALVSSTLPPLDNNGAPVVANLGVGFSGIQSNTGPSVVSSFTVDGTLAGKLSNYTVNRNGEVISTFTNGEQSVVGKVAIYHFQNDQGLEAVSGNSFRATQNSGKAIFYETNNGQLLSATLENSNVTLDTALTELIILQRSYDAASKTIATGDEMLKNALNMGA